jgi:hypothetical protein
VFKFSIAAGNMPNLVDPATGGWGKVLIDPFNSTYTTTLGVVRSLNRMAATSAQLLKEMVPKAAAIAYLVNPSSPSAEIYAMQAPTVASALGIRVPVLNASTEHDLDECYASLGKIRADALIVLDAGITSVAQRSHGIKKHCTLAILTNSDRIVHRREYDGNGPSRSFSSERRRVSEALLAVGTTVGFLMLPMAGCREARLAKRSILSALLGKHTA